MITIQTTVCRLEKADSSLANGSITIIPNGVWEYDDAGVRRLISKAPIVITITDGIMVDAAGDPATVDLAPTSGSGVDIASAAYYAVFDIDEQAWTETWELPAGTSPVELTSITKLDTTATATTPVGATGPAGADGADGADGEGVPVGGTAGQVLKKIDGTDFNTEWGDDNAGGAAVRVDLGAEVSDYSMAVGEEGYVDFASSALVPLNVACADGQMYEIFIQFSALTGNWSSNSAMLYPNNAADASAFAYNRDYLGSSDGSGVADGFLLGIGNVSTLRAMVSNTSVARVAMGWATGTVGGTFFPADLGSSWNDLITAWSSLGSIWLIAAASGQIIVKRVK